MAGRGSERSFGHDASRLGAEGAGIGGSERPSSHPGVSWTGSTGDQAGAIERMRLGQQLRTAEAELEKLQRLHAAKSRRAMELEDEMGLARVAAGVQEAEMAKLRKERNRLKIARGEEAARAEALQAEVARLQLKLTERQDAIHAMEREHTRLLHRIDTLETAASASVPPASWRPPRHPDLGSLNRLWPQLSVTGPPDGAAAAASARSSASNSTQSASEWPDELLVS